MITVAVQMKIDGEHVLAALQEAGEKMDPAAGEFVLDFSSVRRLETDALQELSTLVAAAEQKGIKIVLHGVSPELYKVFKLTGQASQLAFVN